MAKLHITCLGAFQAVLNGQPLTDFYTEKSRALLAYLVMESSRPHQREHLAGLLWSDQPEERALHSLRQVLSNLRKALDDNSNTEPYIIISREGVQFNPHSDYWLDVKAFTQLLLQSQDHGTGGGQNVNLRLVRRAVVMYQGRFLDQFHLNGSPLFDEWAALVREDLDRRAVQALEVLINYHERRGEIPQTLAAATRLTELVPWDETAHATVMHLLAVQKQWSAAQNQYRLLCRFLDQEMGLKPAPEIVAKFTDLRTRAARNDPPPLRYPPPRHNLPAAADALIGRETELEDLAASLADPHCLLLTLAGPGGIGKSRLALESAREQIGLFEEGVFWVPLAAISQPQQLPAALADALGITFSARCEPQEEVLDYLRSKRVLLVLDNMEHLLPLSGDGLLENILQQAPRVKLLVTTRERLNLREECLYALDGLQYPRSATEHSAAYAAMQLFEQAARRVQRNFDLTREAEPVMQICQLLEGLPLGIELAAAQLWTRSCRQVVDDLRYSLERLTDSAVNALPRHHSLRAAFNISWHLLQPAEQDVFCRLSVFCGGFSLLAAQQVLAADGLILSQLINKSLLRLNGERYEMHAALRQFAAERLAESAPRSQETIIAHAQYFAELLAELNSDLKGAAQPAALAQISLELENIRTAWHSLLEQGLAQLAADSVDSLYHYFNIRSRFAEGIELLSTAASRLAENPAWELPLAMVLSRLGGLAHRIRNNKMTEDALARSYEILIRQGHKTELAYCLILRGGAAQRKKGYQQALELAQQGLALYREVGDVWGESYALYLVGLLHYSLGQVEQAQQDLQHSLERCRRTGDRRRLIAPLNVLGDIACHLGQYDQARGLFEESLTISRDLSDRFNTGMVLLNLGTVDQRLGNHATAAALYRESGDVSREIGDLVGEGIALSNLGEIYCAERNFAEARKNTQQGLKICRSVDDTWSITACLNTLAEIGLEEGNYAQAWRYLYEAIDLCQETQTLQMLTRAVVLAGGLYLRQNTPAKALRVLAASLRHSACQEDYINKGQQLLAEYGLKLEESTPTLEEVTAEVLAERPSTG